MYIDFLKVLMSGVQAHIQSPIAEVRHIGMSVGQSLMNMLHHTTDDAHKLKFDYEPNSDTTAIEKLARPVQEQEEELRKRRKEREEDGRGGEKVGGGGGGGGGKVGGGGGKVGGGGGGGEKFGEGVGNANVGDTRTSTKANLRTRSSSSSSSSSCASDSHGQFGEGYVHAVDCSDSDSDDDLVPYAMDDDPDASECTPPRYLRTLMQGTYMCVCSTL